MRRQSAALLLIGIAIFSGMGIFAIVNSAHVVSASSELTAAVITASTLTVAIGIGGVLTRWTNLQKLWVRITVPDSASPQTIPLLLDNNDLLIFKALMKHGTISNDRREIRYRGKTIYDPAKKAFKLAGKSYTPRQLQVTKVKGQ